MNKCLEFDKLPREKQLEIINQNADFLMERDFLGMRVTLMYLYDQDMYVEIWFDTRTDVITTILPFTSTICLTPYLDTIDIKDAVS